MNEQSDDLSVAPDPNSHPSDYRSGFVAVVGRPNVGKSTLLNALLGEKLAIVSPKPQTTRTRQLGILSDESRQIIFVDTPGIHEPHTRLGEYMVQSAIAEIPNADVTLFLVDVSEPLKDADYQIARTIKAQAHNTVIVVLNKIDLVDTPTFEQRQEELGTLLPTAQFERVSAERRTNLDSLLERIASLLPVGPQYYPDDQITDTHIRDNVAELIREKALLLFEDEIPHSLAVQVDQFKERSADMTYISATIYVEKDSQKGIVIGKQGAMLKKLGQIARPEIEDILDTKVFLELWVKVLKNWRRDPNALKRMGYHLDRE